MKTLFKKSFAVFLSAVLLLSVLPFTVSAATIVKSGTTGSCTWTLDSEGTLTISGNGRMGDYWDYIFSSNQPAPWKDYYVKKVVIQEGVTNVGNEAFYDCWSLTTVTIPNSVTSISGFAFAKCRKLTAVDIPESVTSIGSCAFEYCDKLTTVTIPDSVLRIDESAFYACWSLTSVVISNSVTSIASCAFQDCDSLTTVSIPNSVTRIGDFAFCSCDSLTTVMIPDSVTSIGTRAFENCDMLTAVNIPDSVTTIGLHAFGWCNGLLTITVDDNNDAYSSIDGNLYNKSGTTLIQYPAGKPDVSFTVPESVTCIGNYAFLDCDNLTTVTIPDAVTTIGDGAFKSCGSLTSVMIPDSVTAIGTDAFKDSGNLTLYGIAGSYAETYANNNSIPFISIEDHADFSYCMMDGLINGPIEITGYTGNGGDVVIPSVIDGYTVASIGSNAFYMCSSLTSVTIPDSVTSIGDFAFYCCSSLTAVTIPDSVTSIGDFAFTGCSSLTAVTIPDSVLTVGYEVFHSCSNLRQVMLSNSLTEISTGMFNLCWSLTSITIPDSVTSIGDSAFGGCWNLSDITIHDSVTSIGSYAFESCYLLKSIHIPKNVSMIANDAYAFFSGQTSITVDPNNPVYDSRNNCNAIIETASNTLIKGCGKTIIPDTVTSIGENALADCAISTMIIPGSVTSIGKNAFWWCSSLTSIFIPESVTAIGKDAFYQCNNLTIYGIAGSYAETYANQNNIPFVAVTDFGTTGDCIWWLDSVGTLNVSGDGKMANYPNSLNLPWGTDRVNTAVFEDGVTNIGKCAFKNNTGLQSVTIPDSVTAINSFAFYGCTALQTITIPSSVTSIGTSVFDNCNNLTIYGVKGSYAETFAGQNNIPFVAVCPSCGSTETEVVPAVAATYTQAGTTAGIRCKNCGEWFVEPKIVAKLEEEIVNSGTTGDCTWTLDSGGTLTVSGSGNMGNYANSLNLPWGSNQVKAVIIEDGVTSIGKCAFKNNKGLQSITIPDSVTAVKSFAFYGCASLQTILIPPSVTDIGLSSFSYCNSLIIFGEKGSYAESYAAQNSIPFVPVCPFCGNSDFEVIPGGTDGSQEMYCTHCNKWTVLPETAPMASVSFTVGDLGGDGVLTIDDATLLQQVLAEFIELDLEDEITFLQADANGDGYVNVKDVTAIQRKVAELI